MRFFGVIEEEIAVLAEILLIRELVPPNVGAVHLLLLHSFARIL